LVSIVPSVSLRRRNSFSRATNRSSEDVDALIPGFDDTGTPKDGGLAARCGMQAIPLVVQ